MKYVIEYNIGDDSSYYQYYDNSNEARKEYNKLIENCKKYNQMNVTILLMESNEQINGCFYNFKTIEKIRL